MNKRWFSSDWEESNSIMRIFIIISLLFTGFIIGFISNDALIRYLHPEWFNAPDNIYPESTFCLEIDSNFSLTWKNNQTDEYLYQNDTNWQIIAIEVYYNIDDHQYSEFFGSSEYRLNQNISELYMPILSGINLTKDQSFRVEGFRMVLGFVNMSQIIIFTESNYLFVPPLSLSLTEHICYRIMALEIIQNGLIRGDHFSIDLIE